MKLLMKSLLLLAMPLLLCGCSSDEDGVITRKQLKGKWWAVHHTKAPNGADTFDMWDYTFGSNGTGTDNSGRRFQYEISGDHITLRYQDTANYFGRMILEYKITDFSKDHMTWDEITDEEQGIYGIILGFSRK